MERNRLSVVTVAEGSLCSYFLDRGHRDGFGDAPLAFVHGSQVGDVNELWSAQDQDGNGDGQLGLDLGLVQVRGGIFVHPNLSRLQLHIVMARNALDESSSSSCCFLIEPGVFGKVRLHVGHVVQAVGGFR